MYTIVFRTLLLKTLLIMGLVLFGILVMAIQPAIALSSTLAPTLANMANMPTNMGVSTEANLKAATEDQSTPFYQSDPTTKTISSEKVSQFVQAYLQVVAVIDRRASELRRAETNSESNRIEQDIASEAFKIIEQANLTRQEYLQLLGLANTDPDFRERVVAQLQEVSP